MQGRYQIEQVTWQGSQTELEYLRRLVFVDEQQVPEEEEWDDRDADALHFLASDENGSPIGSVRLLHEGKITRMAVKREWRGRGVGAALLAKVFQKAAQLHLRKLELAAQLHAVGFYQKFGFFPVGEPFLEVGIPHIHMNKPMSQASQNRGNDMHTDESVVRFDHPSDILPMMREFVEHAQRTLDIFSHQLTQALYDDPTLIDGISALARRGAQTQVRVLVRDPRPLYGSDRPLLNLIQRLPSHMAIRAYTEGASDPRMGFFCVDGEQLIHFADEPNLSGYACRHARAESRQLLDEFEHLWVYGSKQDVNLRRLSL